MGFPIYKEFKTTLNPGDWQGFSMGPSTLDRAYVAAYQLAKPATNSGFLEKSVFLPEWDGRQWNTVLRLQMSNDVQPQPASVRVYEISRMPVYKEFVTTLNPGEWQGHSMGPCDDNLPLIAAFEPMSRDGFLETHRFQPEWDGHRWNNVLRLQIAKHVQPMKLRARIYRVQAPVVNKFDARLNGGQWTGFNLGPATLDRGYLAAYEPQRPPVNRGFLEKSRFQPEWDGRQWNNVLRLQISNDLPSLHMPTMVYGIGR